jgi:radical SAM protein with 4Fe4S-binding SPASM domain
MSMKIYEKAIEEFSRMGGGSVSHNGLVGEPLLDTTLFDKLRIASSYQQIRPCLYTNGILLGQGENVERILESGISRLFISVSDFEETSYKRIFRVDKYHEVLQGIARLITSNKQMKNGIEVFLNVRTDKSRREVFSSDDYKRIIAPLFDGKYFRRDHIVVGRWFDSWCGQIQEKDLLDNMCMKADPRIKSLPCERTFYLEILPDGCVRACPCRFGRKGTHDELIVGNIAETNLEEIWAGEKMREIREGFLENELPEVCSSCNDYTYPSLKQYTLKRTTKV